MLVVTANSYANTDAFQIWVALSIFYFNQFELPSLIAHKRTTRSYIAISTATGVSVSCPILWESWECIIDSLRNSRFKSFFTIIMLVISTFFFVVNRYTTTLKIHSTKCRFQGQPHITHKTKNKHFTYRSNEDSLVHIDRGLGLSYPYDKDTI